MKKTLAFFTFCMLFVISNAQTKWDYPIKPGTTEWANLKSYSEMVHACQIPDNILKSLSTKELVDVCMDYPLIMNFFAYDTVSEGIERVSTKFNGLQELLKRSDNQICISDYLKDFDFSCLVDKSLSDYESAFRTKSQLLAENLLMFNDVIANSDKTSQETTVRTAYIDLLTKGAQLDFFGKKGVKSSAILLYKYLCKLDNTVDKSPLLNQFANGFLDLDASVIKELMFYYSSIINK